MPKYGDKRDYRKIEIFVSGRYVGTTTWSRTLKEAVQRYADMHKLSLAVVKAAYSKL